MLKNVKHSICLKATSLLRLPFNDVVDLVIDVLQISLHWKEFKELPTFCNAW